MCNSCDAPLSVDVVTVDLVPVVINPVVINPVVINPVVINLVWRWNINISVAGSAVFDNSYARLPERFYSRQSPTAVPSAALIKLNRPLARQMGIDPDWASSADGVSVLAGNVVPAGADPLAMAYAGHQFGGWVPQLGDGRAILLGEIVDGDGLRLDIQLKGAGRTPYSRMGDGRAWVGPVIREYLVSETMAAFGIPTTRALAAVATGETIYRESQFPGAILTRVARGHVRVGSFEFFAGQGDVPALKQLADHVIDRHYPSARTADNPYTALLEDILLRQASLVARWQWVGFIHGVMNTDNMSVSGETIDYGPCAFLDTYDPHKVFSSIDQRGRYAYNKQPGIAQWNLAVLAQCLLPLIDADSEKAVAEAQRVIDTFPSHYQSAFVAGMRDKLGLSDTSDDDLLLGSELLECMAEQNADFTLVFRALSRLESKPAEADESFCSLFDVPAAVQPWLDKWRERIQSHQDSAEDASRQARMLLVNPAIIPRNHRIEEVIAAAVEGDYQPFERLHSALTTPFSEPDDWPELVKPPEADEQVMQTFCGT